MDEIITIFENAKKENRYALLEYESKEILKIKGIVIPSSRTVKTEEEAIDAFNELGKRVAMKLMSPQVLHKTEQKAVVINVDSEELVKSTYTKFMNSFAGYEIKGVLVEEMVQTGIEIIVGSKIDQTFGPVMLVGPGGVFVEVIRDVVFRMCPISKRQATSAITEIKTQKLLDGFRDMPKVDREKLAELMVKLSHLSWDYKEYIAEMDINPIIANEDGLFPVDARIILKR